jgi:hypothetical protein
MWLGESGKLSHAAIRISLAISERPRRHVTATANASRSPAAAIAKEPGLPPDGRHWRGEIDDVAFECRTRS